MWSRSLKSSATAMAAVRRLPVRTFYSGKGGFRDRSEMRSNWIFASILGVISG